MVQGTNTGPHETSECQRRRQTMCTRPRQLASVKCSCQIVEFLCSQSFAPCPMSSAEPGGQIQHAVCLPEPLFRVRPTGAKGGVCSRQSVQAERGDGYMQPASRRPLQGCCHSQQQVGEQAELETDMWTALHSCFRGRFTVQALSPRLSPKGLCTRPHMLLTPLLQ
jgi:hypothetical protein